VSFGVRSDVWCLLWWCCDRGVGSKYIRRQLLGCAMFRLQNCLELNISYFRLRDWNDVNSKIDLSSLIRPLMPFVSGMKFHDFSRYHH
jgi:hypothetical protein